MIACCKEKRKFYNTLEKLSKTHKQPFYQPPLSGIKLATFYSHNLPVCFSSIKIGNLATFAL